MFLASLVLFSFEASNLLARAFHHFFFKRPRTISVKIWRCWCCHCSCCHSNSKMKVLRRVSQHLSSLIRKGLQSQSCWKSPRSKSFFLGWPKWEKVCSCGQVCCCQICSEAKNPNFVETETARFFSEAKTTHLKTNLLRKARTNLWSFF